MKNGSSKPGVLGIGIAAVMLALSLTIRSENQRAVAVLVASGLVCYAWIVLRARVKSRLGLGLLGSGLATLVLACAWSGLNVARFHLYNPAIEGPAIYSTWYEIVCTTQVVLQWCGTVLALAFVVGLAVFPFWTHIRSARENR